jgi:erythrin-vacuolar iron transport family protein
MKKLHMHWKGLDDRDKMLQYVQPGLIGLIDGTVSTIAPLIAAAVAAGSHAALIVGLAASAGAAISMGLSESLSDDGILTGRGEAWRRGLVTGAGTFIGGLFHTLPFLISDVNTALTLAFIIIAIELVTIAFVRKRYLQVSMKTSLIQVTLGGFVVAVMGYALGHG